MAVYTAMPLLELFLNGLRLPFSAIWSTFLVQTSIQLREISQWFVLLWLLQLNESLKLVRFIRIVAIVSVIAGFLDGTLGFFYPNVFNDIQFQTHRCSPDIFYSPV